MQAISPVIEQLGPNLDFQVNYIGDKKGDQLNSMHGPKEVTGDIAQLCAIKLAPNTFMKMIDCQNKSPQQVDTNWKECAKEADINQSDLSNCIEGNEGKALLDASFEKSQSRGASGSPTIFLNNKPYQGGRQTKQFLKAICNEYSGAKPEACTNIPVPPKVQAFFLSDKRCPKCDIAPLEPRLRNEFGGLTVTHLDYMSEEGKKLYNELHEKNANFRFLPAILFDKSIEQDKDGMATIQRFLVDVGDYKSLRLGGQFDPTAEICDNKIDDTNNGKIDCDDPTCKEDLICRPEKPNQIDLFVMSQCPYGAKAVIAMQDVIKNFAGKLKLNIHFIGSEQGGKLTSMHGPAEVEEDIRQACAIKQYTKNQKYMSYLTCRSADYRSPNWEACTGKDGISASVIKKCVESEGEALLKKDFELAQLLNINASPTLLANNKYKFNGIDAETIKKNFCQYNSSLDGCKNTLSSNTSGNVPAGSCAQ